MVDLVLRSVVWGSPSGFVDALMWKDTSSNHQLVQGAQVRKTLTIFIHLSQSMCLHDVLVARFI